MQRIMIVCHTKLLDIKSFQTGIKLNHIYCQRILIEYLYYIEIYRVYRTGYILNAK